MSEGSFSKSSEPSHLGVDNWTAKNLEYGLSTANNIHIVGNSGEGGHRSCTNNIAGLGNERGPPSAGDVGQTEGDLQRLTGEHEG